MSDSIQAPLNYLGHMHEKPIFHVFDTLRHNFNLKSHTVPIKDARALPQRASLEREGFCLVRHPTTATRRLECRREVLRVHGPEVEKLVAELTGATIAIAEPIGVVRVAQLDARASGVLAHPPVKFVHTDFTFQSATQLIQRLLRLNDQQLPDPEPRCVIYNVSRSLTPPPQDLPLALCDLRSTEPDDAITADSLLDFPGSRPAITEMAILRFNAKHAWYYFPNMCAEEVLIFKSFDSGAQHAGRVAHSAFPNPTCRCGVPTRTSLDLRVLAVF